MHRKFLAMSEPAFLAEKKQLILAYLREHPEFLVRKTLRRVVYYWTGYWSFSAKEISVSRSSLQWWCWRSPEQRL